MVEDSVPSGFGFAGYREHVGAAVLLCVAGDDEAGCVVAVVRRREGVEPPVADFPQRNFHALVRILTIVATPEACASGEGGTQQKQSERECRRCAHELPLASAHDEADARAFGVFSPDCPALLRAGRSKVPVR